MPVQSGSAATPLWLSLSSNKATYSVGAPVVLSADTPPGSGMTLQVRYFQLDRVLATKTLVAASSGTTSWIWNPPKVNYKGYLVEVSLRKAKSTAITETIGIDVSSDWSRFPRYGFLSDFSSQQIESQKNVIENLKRYRINGLQFYDWQDRHDQPLKVVNGKPVEQWLDIASRETYLSNVRNYIDLAHASGMAAMNYNLIMGAYDDYQTLGISPTWGIYSDPLHQNQDGYPLPGYWESGLKLFDPANSSWQNYIIDQESQVQKHLKFDGWHVDQLGERTAFNYLGKPVNLASGYAALLEKAKTSYPGRLVMNAVDSYGQREILATNATKFAYAELWGSSEGYGDILWTIEDNWAARKDRPNTVLAAYVNRGISNSSGSFNTHSVLTTDAAIFASGGAHIELGEHLLANEYFPNSNLSPSDKLMTTLMKFYDFSVGYENLLRDGVRPLELDVKIKGHQTSAGVAASNGTIWTIARRSADSKTKVIHLINLKSAKTSLWRDNFANQPSTKKLFNLTITVPISSKVNKIWTASPDVDSGSPKSLKFTQSRGQVTVTLPSLLYWDMLVVQ